MCLTKSRCAINGNYGKQDTDYCCCLVIKDLRHTIGARMACGVHRFIFVSLTWNILTGAC